MIKLHETTLEAHVKHAVGQLVDAGDRLRSLADLLEELGATRGDAEPIELKRTVVAVQSIAMQALLAAAGAAGLADRIRTVAELKESAGG